jgi:mitochondrial protein MBA1
VTWALEKYRRTPATFFLGLRVVSDRATQIPELPNSGIRQVVVRITSRQSTGTVTIPKRATESLLKVKEQNCTEYIVLQKLMWSGEEDDWRIWGHANPTTVDDLDSPWFAQGLTLSERLSLMQDAVRRK